MDILVALSRGLRRDLTLAWRGLRRRIGFFALVVVVLAMGIGSAVAAFGVLEAMQLRPLPFAEPDRLIQIGLSHESRPLETESIFRQDLLTFGDRRDLLSGVGWFATGGVTVGDAGRADRYAAGYVSTSLFPLLGVRPARGRLFTNDDDIPETPLTVIISHQLWQLRFESREDIVGQEVRIGQQAATIVGVMPTGFAFPYAQDLWLPWSRPAPDPTDVSRAIGVARLSADVGLDRVTESLAPILEQSRQRTPTRYQRRIRPVMSPEQPLHTDYRRSGPEILSPSAWPRESRVTAAPG